jgi:undecaprenyl-diphosphatase
MIEPLVLGQAILLGMLEAGTEFLPVSSTGHLLLAGHVLGFEGPPGKVFEIAIQLGAIAAIVVLYFAKLWQVLVDMPRRDERGVQARQFVVAVLVAFLPAAVAGVLLHDVITRVLFDPIVVCAMLVVGGLVILGLEDRFESRVVAPMGRTVAQMDWTLALKIGVLQCLALVPGVSRSGATIMGALWLGMSRVAAAEFSFFLAIPTMLGAVVYSLYKQREMLVMHDAMLIGVGLATAFVVALVVVKWLVGFVARRSFRPFAWYRIGLGGLGLMYLALGY